MALILFIFVQDTLIDETEFRRIVQRCKDLISFSNLITVVHVRRDANRAAHTLARQSCLVQNPTVGFDILNFLVNVLKPICFFNDH